MSNMEIRQKMLMYNVKSYELAQSVGIYPSTLSVWLRTELSDDRKKRVEKALNKLIKSK